MREHNRFEIFGLRFIESPYLTRRVMYRKPEFEQYEWLRQFSCYRWVRAAYIRRVRRKWQNDPSNWKEVPREEILKTPDGTLIIHPKMKHRITKMMFDELQEFGERHQHQSPDNDV